MYNCTCVPTYVITYVHFIPIPIMYIYMYNVHTLFIACYLCLSTECFFNFYASFSESPFENTDARTQKKRRKKNMLSFRSECTLTLTVHVKSITRIILVVVPAPIRYRHRYATYAYAYSQSRYTYKHKRQNTTTTSTTTST